MRKFLNINKLLVFLLVSSFLLKLALFAYAAASAPTSKFMPDSPTYIEPGVNLVTRGAFAAFGEDGRPKYEVNRTPGYPLFIGIIVGACGLSFDYVVILQILLATIAGFIIYKASSMLEERTALLASFIFLFDLPVAISTLQILTEALYTFFVALFIYFFLTYLRHKRVRPLLASVLTLAAATYIRPISYYLGACLAIGICYALYRVDMKKAFIHAFVFFVLFYSLVGAWQFRNQARTGRPDFTTVDDFDLHNTGIVAKYARAGGLEATGTGPVRFYAGLTAKTLYQLFTVPGTLKYLGSDALKTASKLFGYPWVIFWLAGLLAGRHKDIRYKFLLWTMLYFVAATVLGTGVFVGSRFRVPIMPFISILSSAGWKRLLSRRYLSTSSASCL